MYQTKIESQIAKCQDPWTYLDGTYRSYGGAIEDNERRMKKGEKQELCGVCKRFTWLDQRCELFEPGSKSGKNKQDRPNHQVSP